MTKQMIENEADVQTLWNMLRTRRPAGSKSERRFIRDFLWPLELNMDSAGNLWKRIGDSPVMWSCHTDTVHKEGGNQNIWMKDGFITLSPEQKSNCLGADDTAGAWLMREMILAKRPGLYIFHRAEEIGGLGSRHIAKNEKQLVDGIECAIAFDRRRTTDIITHQSMGRCCSETFGKSLAQGLNLYQGMNYSNSSLGVFTDTANYTDLIGECTNVSVGYLGEHTERECLNYGHILMLRESLMQLDIEKLTFERKAGEFDKYDWVDYGDWRYGGYGHNATTFTTTQKPKVKKAFDFFDDEEEGDLDRLDLVALCHEFPDSVADFLEHYGVDENELRNYIAGVYARPQRY